MTHYLEIQSDLSLQSLNFKLVTLIKGQLLTYAELDNLLDKIGVPQYLKYVKPNIDDITLKRSNIDFSNGIRKRK